MKVQIRMTKRENSPDHRVARNSACNYEVCHLPDRGSLNERIRNWNG